MTKASAFSVQPAEAIAFMQRWSGFPSCAWDDLWQRRMQDPMVFVGPQREQLIAEIHLGALQALVEGSTFETFRKNFAGGAIGQALRGSSGFEDALRVAFETSLRIAYSAGRWEQSQRNEKLSPYARYVYADQPARGHDPDWPAHCAWHDTVLPISHPWWNTHWAPNGWGCRCYVESLSERDIKRYGLKLSEAPPRSPIDTHIIQTAAGPLNVASLEGIGPGFAVKPWMAGTTPGSSPGAEGQPAMTPLLFR